MAGVVNVRTKPHTVYVQNSKLVKRKDIAQLEKVQHVRDYVHV